VAKKKPPMKLVWLDLCRAWIIGDTERVNRSAELPDGVSLVAAQSVVSVLMSVAASNGTGCLASAKWVSERTATNRTRVVGPLLACLVEEGWLNRIGRVRSKQANTYQLTIPPGVEAGNERWDGEAHPSSAQDEDTSHIFAAPKVGRGGSSSNAKGDAKGEPQGEPIRPPPSLLEEGEESGTNVPLTLSAIEMDRLRGVLKQVAASRPAIDIHGFSVRNTDLQQEWHRLDQGGWDARKINLAIPRPKSVRSETGWLLSQLRDLPTKPDEDPRVIEAQMLLLAWLSRWTNDEEEAAQYGISRVEYDHLIDQAEAHGYALEDGNWTEDGSRLKRQADDFQNSDDFQSSGDYYDSDDIYDSDDDPRWSLVHQALKVKSKSDVAHSVAEANAWKA